MGGGDGGDDGVGRRVKKALPQQGRAIPRRLTSHEVIFRCGTASPAGLCAWNSSPLRIPSPISRQGRSDVRCRRNRIGGGHGGIVRHRRMDFRLQRNQHLIPYLAFGYLDCRCLPRYPYHKVIPIAARFINRATCTPVTITRSKTFIT